MKGYEKLEQHLIHQGKVVGFYVSALSKGGFSMHTNPVIMIARC